MGDQKLGQPVPESYLVSEWNSGVRSRRIVRAGLVIVPIFAGEGRLGAFLAGDRELFGR